MSTRLTALSATLALCAATALAPSAADGGGVTRSELQQEKAQLSRVARDAGAQIVGLYVVQRPTTRISLTLRVGSPARFLTKHASSFLKLLNDPKRPLDGFSLELQNRNGNVVWRRTVLSEVSGSIFCAPNLRSVSPVDCGYTL